MRARRQPGLKVIVESDRIVILDRVYFAPNSDVILAKSFSILRQVGLTLKANTEIRRIRVVGHTDNAGTDAFNQDLSERRARNAAMGPVPFLREWQPVDGAIDNSGRLGSPTLGGAFQMLIGGGWLMFSDASRCCGVNLAPLPWRTLDDRRARRQLEQQLSPKGLAARLQSDRGARAWQCSVSDRGLSYSVHDSSDNRVGLEAFWFDQFGQAWRLSYWLHSREHGRDAGLRLEGCCSSVTGA